VGDGPISALKEIKERCGVASVGRLMRERTKGEGDQTGVTPLIVVGEHTTNKPGTRVGIRRRLFPTSRIAGPVALVDGKLRDGAGCGSLGRPMVGVGSACAFDNFSTD
jgi:hypothetical protein